MKIHILSIIAMLLLVVPIISAADYTTKIGEDFNLIASCDVNGIPCNPSTGACNLTLRNPDENYVVNYQPMTLSVGGDINYTLLTNQLTQLGNYPGKINCIDAGENKTATFILAVTPTGDERGYSLFLVMSIASLLVLALGIWAENEYVGFLAGVLFMVTGIYSMIYGIGNLADLYTRAIAFSSIGLGLIFEIAAGYKVVEGITQNRAF
jgi:hypothetical protein